MDRNDVEAVKARLSIAEVVRRYVDLKPMSGRWVAPCPFHQETKPSFSVNDEEGFYYCFGCQASGDVIDFFQRVNGLEFREALEQLAAEAGVELGNMPHDPQASQKKAQKKLYLEMHNEAARWFKDNLRLAAGQVARDYLNKRGMNNEIIDRFGLGCSPEDWHGLDNFLRSRGRKPEDGVAAGLLSKNEKGNIYDRFRARLIFPIQDLSGRVIAFGGRIITDGEPKYLNSSDSPIYKKGEHLYGLNVARPTMTRSRRAILTEGYMDVLSLHQFGYTDACGVLGTALTQDQVKRLAGFCSKVILVFDGDNAGRKAALKSAKMILLHGVSCRVVMLPDGKDVDDVLQTEGAPGFDLCLEQAPEGLDFCLNTLRDTFAPRDIMAWAKGFLSDLTDSSLKAYYLPRIASGLGLSEAELRMEAGRPGAYAAQSQTVQPAQKAQSASNAPAVGREDRDDRYFLRFPIQYPDYVPALAERGFERILVTDWARNMWEKLATTQPREILSRLNEHEKSFYIQCREQLRDAILSGRELLDEWKHICEKITVGKKKLTRKQLIQALHDAQVNGDQQRVQELMSTLNDSLGRENEQH